MPASLPQVVAFARYVVVQLRYRYRVYPTRPQRAMLARTFGCVRTVWNDAVAARKAAHLKGLPYPSTAALDMVLITAAKRTPERAWLAEVSTVPLQQALRDCHAAYRNFFDSLSGKRAGGRVGPPRFKRRSHAQSGSPGAVSRCGQTAGCMWRRSGKSRSPGLASCQRRPLA